MKIIDKIANELKVNGAQVKAAVDLLDDGATVPFIARYRKEVTGGLDDTQLRELEQRLGYLRELTSRRDTIIASIEEQGKLTAELKQQLLTAENKSRLEDLYLPYKPKRRTKAQIAREAGLEPLADQLLSDPSLVPLQVAQAFLNADKDIKTPEAALLGARQILMERFVEDAELSGSLREYVWDHALLKSEMVKGKEKEGAKFSDYFDYQESIKKIPSHRALALFRGRREGYLRIKLAFAEDAQEQTCLARIAGQFSIQFQNRAADEWLKECVEWTWKIKFQSKLEIELIARVREAAETEAIHVFANNLCHLLMAAPAGQCVTMGLDPGLRTGVKAAVVDQTGKLLAYETIFPHVPRKEWDKSIHTLARLCKAHNVQLISIGNGTASRETDRLVSALQKQQADLKLTKIMVSEAGASVYSASELAAKEFPGLDVSYRGAVSIARRLQDPLAELVKIDPKAIGVGQYQHDVSQTQLARRLNAVVEDCVNAVGVDLNTASVPLLTRVAGLNATLANHIVEYRNQHGAFKNRLILKKVNRLGEKVFQQCAGFLRIQEGENPLDRSAVHPEAYPVVEKMLAYTQTSVPDLMGNRSILGNLKPDGFVDEQFGLPTVKDILAELEKPGRDPRPEFKTATFKDGVETMADLKQGMQLEGVVSNVTNFGAFVDVGVHQDGLVHMSQLADHFVKDPHQVVKVGDIVNVRVMEVDTPRKRISLSMRLHDTEHRERKQAPPSSAKKKTHKKTAGRGKAESALSSKLAEALSEALK